MSEPIGDLANAHARRFPPGGRSYLDRGMPVGSKAIAGPANLSPASIRGVMQSLEERGLLTHPHTSRRASADRERASPVRRRDDAGVGAGPEERAVIEAGIREGPVEQALAAASATLSGLSACAGVVVTPRVEMRLRQLSFVPLDSSRALAVLVGADGAVENRVVPLPAGTSAMQMSEVANYVSARLAGLTLGEAVARLRGEMTLRREAIDAAGAELVASGLAAWSEDLDQRPLLIVKGASNLVDASAARGPGAGPPAS